MTALKLITETHPAAERQTVSERVYGTLEGHACDSLVRMSQQRLVALTGASIRGVQHALRRLVQGNRLRVVACGNSHSPTIYELFLEPRVELGAKPRSCVEDITHPQPVERSSELSTTPATPAPRNSQFHTTHTPYYMVHGLKTHGRSRAKQNHGQKKWKFTRESLSDDATMLAVAADYAAMGWIASDETGVAGAGAGEAGLVIVFEAAEHALSSIVAKGRSKARSPGAIFVARVKDHRQQTFKPITQDTEDRARLRLKRCLYGEQPARCERDEEII